MKSVSGLSEQKYQRKLREIRRENVAARLEQAQMARRFGTVGIGNKTPWMMDEHGNPWRQVGDVPYWDYKADMDFGKLT